MTVLIPLTLLKYISEISSIVYKSVAHVLALAIALLFNKSLECHTFTDTVSLKKSKSDPDHKGGIMTDINNYRQISNLPILLKNI